MQFVGNQSFKVAKVIKKMVNGLRAKINVRTFSNFPTFIDNLLLKNKNVELEKIEKSEICFNLDQILILQTFA